MWLNKGQRSWRNRIFVIRSEITVGEENGEYVLIRGGLLTGEYRSNGESNSSQGKSTPLSDQVAYRSMKVTLNEDGTGEIKHYFPIDVTIPQERITSLDEILFLSDLLTMIYLSAVASNLLQMLNTGMSSGKVSREEEVIDQKTTLQMEERSFHFEAYQQADPVEDEVVVPFPRNEVQDEEAEEEDVVESRVESRVENQIESSVTEEQIMDEKDRVEPVAQVKK
ncbi:hypothetical protein KHA80_16955 [Anaerobacillus sp. HL2]|nr:hypothetical protein KHA80_16955 [Anaerobacillus sp. HL2]